MPMKSGKSQKVIREKALSRNEELVEVLYNPWRRSRAQAQAAAAAFDKARQSDGKSTRRKRS